MRRAKTCSRWLTFGLTGIVTAALISACGDKKSPTSPTPPPDTPTISGVSPNSGTTFGGTTVTITGTQFAAGATVTIGGTAATDVAVQSPTSLTAKTAQHAAGAVPVTVTVNAKTGTMANAFTYVAQGATQNAAPVIASFKALGSRRNMPQNFADLGETITITAFVSDAETPIDQLTFEWTSAAGAFSGSGPVVNWTAPGSGTQEYELKLTVIEKYQSADANGLPVQAENRTSSSVKVDVHDSRKEISDMAYDFLVDFSNQVGVSQTLRNFTGSCRGTDDEQGDVEKNLREKKINSFTVGTPRVDVAFGGTCNDRGRGGDACAYVNVDWRSTDRASGRAERASGVDQVAALFQGSRWWLCSSDFIGTTTSADRPFLGARVVTQ